MIRKFPLPGDLVSYHGLQQSLHKQCFLVVSNSERSSLINVLDAKNLNVLALHSNFLNVINDEYALYLNKM